MLKISERITSHRILGGFVLSTWSPVVGGEVERVWECGDVWGCGGGPIFRLC